MQIPTRFVFITLWISAAFFSLWLMVHTFSYDQKTHTLEIASKAWSDFGAHIPLIRSFSLGPNATRLLQAKPIESPLYPGEPIRYHFGFYAVVGILEKFGVPLDWALNIPSAIGLFGLMGMIAWVSFLLFRSRVVSLLSVLLFLFNGSLSFLRFFNHHPLSANTLTDILNNSQFPAFGPWDGNPITAFWNLNIYTNQRHLALSFALALAALAITFTVHSRSMRHIFSRVIGLAAIMSGLLFINFPAAAIAALFVAWIAIIKKEARTIVLIAGLASLPAFAALHQFTQTSQSIRWQVGYLIPSPVTMMSWLSFWWHNLGIHTILIPLGFFLAPKAVHKLVGPPLIILFVLPNVLRLSTDMINNHKFFNFFIVVGGMLSAYAIVRIAKRKYIGVVLASLCIVLATLSGIIDLFPVINDTKGSIKDIQTSPVAAYLARNTDPGDIVANSTWFYHPASIGGRAIFSGYTYFTWSYGYDQTTREQALVSIYQAQNRAALCSALVTHNIAVVELAKYPEEYLHPNWTLWDSFTPDFEDPQRTTAVYKTRSLCTL
jgi:hypothetical protein